CARDRDDGGELYTFTIITTRPNALLKPIHDRMPVIYDGEMGRQWLRGPFGNRRMDLDLVLQPIHRGKWKPTRFRRWSIRRKTIERNALSELTVAQSKANSGFSKAQPSSIPMVALPRHSNVSIYLVGVRASFHNQRHRPPKTIKATTL